MERYRVFGMMCAACSASVEKAVRAVSGVTECTVSLLTEEMTVEGTADASEIEAAVERAGYRAQLFTEEQREVPGAKDDGEVTAMRRRLVISLVGLLLLMYLGMGHELLHLPLPKRLADNKARGIAEMVLALFIMMENRVFFTRGLKGVLHGAPNMDTLVAMGSSVAWIYSTVVLIRSDSTAWFFESAAMIVTLITVGKLLEAKAKGKATDALKTLISLAPKEATVRENGKERRIPAEQLKVGDIVVIRPGESIPVDGIITEGHSEVNESALTGESMPVYCGEGDTVHAATVNGNGFLVCRATKVGKDTNYSEIVRLVADSAATKAPIAKLADKVAAIFVPGVIGIAILTIVIRLLLKEDVSEALESGIAVLVISCPCALGLATPVAIMVGSGVGARNGILFKTAASLEQAGRTETVLLDKTGTVTTGMPEVTDVLCAEGIKKTDLLRTAATLEKQSGHVLSEAILCAADLWNISYETEVKDFREIPGRGVLGEAEGSSIAVGNEAMAAELAPIGEDLQAEAERLANMGKTPIYVVRDRQLLGCILVADTLKQDSMEAVAAMKRMNLHVVLLTGDNDKTAQAIGNKLGVDEIFAKQLPGEKAQIAANYTNSVMVGDGINDSPALVKANLGMAIGSGTDVAILAAEVLLTGNSLWDVVTAIQLGRKTLRTVKQNLFWAFFYNVLCIPLAAGALTGLTGLTLNPMIAAAAMSLSSLFVVTNALRINRFRPEARKQIEMKRSIPERENQTEDTEKENAAMKTVHMEVDGMMCEHCAARVRKALMAVEGVSEVFVDLEAKNVTITCNNTVLNDDLRKSVEMQDYKVGNID